MSAEPGERRIRRGRLAFAVGFAGTFALMAVWSFASPLMSSPDEPVHVIKAAAVVRGELVGHLVGPSSSPTGTVTVPAFYAQLRNVPACYHRNSVVPASCAQLPNGGSAPTAVDIYNARYPPLYYAMVGLPSLLGAGDTELYLMRLVSALLCALFIGLAAFAITRWSRSRLGYAGLVVAATPMVFFLGGSVNPAGAEAAAAICVWASGSVLVLEHLDDPPLGLVALVAASAAALSLIRPISPFWLALIAVVLVAVAEPRSLLAAVRLRRVQVAAAAVAVVAALATAWILLHHSFDVLSASGVASNVPESTVLETSFRHNIYYLPGMIGVFGWFDTYSPMLTYVVWYGLVGLLGLLAAAVAKIRQAAVLAIVAIGILVIPVLISSSQARRYGYTWAGKDTLAFAVGLPLLAAALAGRSALVNRHTSRLVGLVAALAVLAHGAAFLEMLRRYAVGTNGPDFGFFSSPKWQPPISLAGAFVAMVLLLCAMAWLTWAGARPEPQPRHSRRHREALPHPDGNGAGGSESGEPGPLAATDHALVGG